MTMLHLSNIAVGLIIFFCVMSVSVILMDVFRRDMIDWFVWARIFILSVTGGWYLLLAIGFIPVPLSWPSIVSRFLVTLLVGVVFYDRFRSQ